MKLHIGCGTNFIEGWLNIDQQPPADKVINIIKGLPFKDNSVSYIYNEHFIEHLTLKDGIAFLIECNRVLNGIIRLSTPDLDYLISCYQNKILIQKPEYGWCPSSLCDMINDVFYKWEHQYLYNQKKLENILKETGFSNIRKQKYKESKHQFFKNIESRTFGNELIMEASNGTGHL